MGKWLIVAKIEGGRDGAAVRSSHDSHIVYRRRAVLCHVVVFGKLSINISTDAPALTHGYCQTSELDKTDGRTAYPGPRYDCCHHPLQIKRNRVVFISRAVLGKCKKEQTSSRQKQLGRRTASE